jgi:hypothetical protein
LPEAAPGRVPLPKELNHHDRAAIRRPPRGRPRCCPVPAGEDGDAIEGTVVPFPGSPAPAAPAPRKAAFGQRGELRPIIPSNLKTIPGIRKAVAWRLKRARHISLYHLLRSPKRLPLTVMWAVVGAARLVFLQSVRERGQVVYCLTVWAG